MLDVVTDFTHLWLVSSKNAIGHKWGDGLPWPGWSPLTCIASSSEVLEWVGSICAVPVGVGGAIAHDGVGVVGDEVLLRCSFSFSIGKQVCHNTAVDVINGFGVTHPLAEALNSSAVMTVVVFECFVEQVMVHLGFCFSVGHAYAEDGADGIDRFAKEYGDSISHLHLHDVRRRGDTHLPLGAGEIAFDQLVDRLPAFDGTVAIEVFSDDQQLLEDSIGRARRLLG